MSTTDFPIDGIPAEPGMYESKQFPVTPESITEAVTWAYDPYFKYEDGAFHEGDRNNPETGIQAITDASQAQELGPFRFVRELTDEEAGR